MFLKIVRDEMFNWKKFESQRHNRKNKSLFYKNQGQWTKTYRLKCFYSSHKNVYFCVTGQMWNQLTEQLCVESMEVLKDFCFSF